METPLKNILINNDKSNFYNDKNVIKVGLTNLTTPKKTYLKLIKIYYLLCKLLQMKLIKTLMKTI